MSRQVQTCWASLGDNSNRAMSEFGKSADEAIGVIVRDPWTDH